MCMWKKLSQKLKNLVFRSFLQVTSFTLPPSISWYRRFRFGSVYTLSGTQMATTLSFFCNSDFLRWLFPTADGLKPEEKPCSCDLPYSFLICCQIDGSQLARHSASVLAGCVLAVLAWLCRNCLWHAVLSFQTSQLPYKPCWARSPTERMHMLVNQAKRWYKAKLPVCHNYNDMPWCSFLQWRRLQLTTHNFIQTIVYINRGVWSSRLKCVIDLLLYYSLSTILVRSDQLCLWLKLPGHYSDHCHAMHSRNIR